MKTNVDKVRQHADIQRALELGRADSPVGLAELCALAKNPSDEVRRLAASAIGKLAVLGADPSVALAALRPMALHESHPQVRQYAIKAIKCYGAAAANVLHDLADIAADPILKDYVRLAAQSAHDAITAAIAAAGAAAVRRCQRCGRPVSPPEYERSQQAFQRIYCDHCFDEVYLDRRNWETNVELQKTIQARDGTLVQSKGEKLIAEWLAAHRVAYRYDNRFRIIKGYAIRPDFYLPEYDLYLEYWGLDTLDYKIGMLEKKKLYQQAGKKLVSFYYTEYGHLPQLLAERLGRYFKVAGTDAASPSSPTPPGRSLHPSQSPVSPSAVEMRVGERSKMAPSTGIGSMHVGERSEMAPSAGIGSRCVGERSEMAPSAGIGSRCVGERSGVASSAGIGSRRVGERSEIAPGGMSHS